MKGLSSNSRLGIRLLALIVVTSGHAIAGYFDELDECIPGSDDRRVSQCFAGGADYRTYDSSRRAGILQISSGSGQARSCTGYLVPVEQVV